MNHERVKDALVYRAEMWHKATSYRAKPDYRKHSTTDTYPEAGGRVTVSINVKWLDARKEAEVLTAKARREYWEKALEAGRTLVNVLVEETVEQRPKPLETVTINDVVYVLQSVEGEVQRYVRADLWDETRVRLNPITHAERIEKEIITMREMLATNLMTNIDRNDAALDESA